MEKFHRSYYTVNSQYAIITARGNSVENFQSIWSVYLVVEMLH